MLGGSKVLEELRGSLADSPPSLLPEPPDRYGKSHSPAKKPDLTKARSLAKNFKTARDRLFFPLRTRRQTTHELCGWGGVG